MADTVESMDQEAAGGIPVHRRKRIVRRSQNRVRGIGNSERGEECGHCVLVQNLHLDGTASKAKHVDMQNLWIRGASKSKRFVTKKVGANMYTLLLHSTYQSTSTCHICTNAFALAQVVPQKQSCI